MTSNIPLALVLLTLSVALFGCQKSSGDRAPEAAKSAATTPTSSQEGAQPEKPTPKAPSELQKVEGGDAGAPARPSGADSGLPAPCQKLLVCCEEWVKVKPTAEVGCTAQRNAFRAAKTDEAKAQLGDLCQQALEAWSQLTDIPKVCKPGS